MAKYHIHDLKSLKKYFQTIDNPIFAVGARPYNLTIGMMNLAKHFEILAAKGTAQETADLEKVTKITYLQKAHRIFRDKNNFQNYLSKKPSDLFRDKTIITYLDSFKNPPILLFFKITKETLRLLKSKPYFKIYSDLRMFNKYENKIIFFRLLKKLGIETPKNTVLKATKLDYALLKKELGEKFVIQLPSMALGSGTFFILKEKDYHDMLQKPAIKEAIANKTSLRITRYINCESSPSMTVCVTKFGVIFTGLQKQIIDAKEVLEKGRRSGVYCGHDWSASSFDKSIEQQAQLVAQKVGDYFQAKENFHGIFGIDFVLEKGTNKLYPIEANVRLLGSFPALSMVQESAGQPLIQGIQVLESLSRNDYVLDIPALNAEMTKNKTGAHINLYAKDNCYVYVSGNIKPGIYQINEKDKTATYLRSGLFFSDLKNNTEILVTSGVPFKSKVYKQHDNILKLISRHAFLDKNNQLNDFIKVMIHFAYKKLALKKI